MTGADAAISNATPAVASRPPVRLAYLVSHPMQEQAPLLARIAREPDIDLTVFFGSDLALRSPQADASLVEGYKHRFLRKLRDTGSVSPFSPINRGIYRSLRNRDGSPAFDALWVHGYASVNALHGIVAANALGIPVLLRAESWLADRPRTGWTLRVKKVFFHLLRPAIAATLPIGSVSYTYWRHYFGHRFPQFMMPNAVDNRYFAKRAEAAAETEAELRKEFGFQPDRPVILFAARLEARQHADHLLEAYRAFVLNRPAHEVPHLLIVGDGEERAPLERWVSGESLEGVRFAGFRSPSELPRFFQLADVFVLPSSHEPWGLVVNEAMAAGTAVIVSTDVGAHTDLVTHGVEGCVYPVGNVAALTEALRSVFLHPDVPRRMGEAARRRIATWTFEHDVRGLRKALAFATRKLRA